MVKANLVLLTIPIGVLKVVTGNNKIKGRPVCSSTFVLGAKQIVTPRRNIKFLIVNIKLNSNQPPVVQ